MEVTLSNSTFHDKPCCDDLSNTNRITKKEQLAPQVKLIEVCAPEIAKKAKPGQFVILRIDEQGERIPLTLVKWSKAKETITLIFQEVGVSTKKLGALKVKDKILNIAGPLGNPSDIKNYSTATIVSGGVGTAAAYPIAKALKEAGNKIIAIVGARNAEMLILENEMRQVADELYISTDDGSKGHKGFVSEVLKTILQKGVLPNIIYAIGPPLMMKATAEVTKPYGIKTIVSLNPIMIDGMGMCGACRVTVGDRTKFACVDGPEFDASIVDFDEIVKRLRGYSWEERCAIKFHEGGIGAW
ncbi:sulfide/dihydroorotate dehydrogenase-like FAD/NAD-binding protein [Candidatus Bathyarchaeota archaeon A05DMB-2]|jgi:ferredoxin--NADP+ reductase|nr:sulfide/dihydroorotate dehydrogenase-like FAD/NAD-binding protein [Candidatus Bathyarchaeota archaeon A05DMB-2]